MWDKRKMEKHAVDRLANYALRRQSTDRNKQANMILQLEEYTLFGASSYTRSFLRTKQTSTSVVVGSYLLVVNYCR
jgi:hypothetical protein